LGYLVYITPIQRTPVDVHLALWTLPLQILQQILNGSVYSYKVNLGTEL